MVVCAYIGIIFRASVRALVRYESFKIKLHSNAFGCIATRARSFPFDMAYANIHTIWRRRTGDHNVNPFAARTLSDALLCEYKAVRNVFELVDCATCGRMLVYVSARARFSIKRAGTSQLSTYFCVYIFWYIYIYVFLAVHAISKKVARVSIASAN